MNVPAAARAHTEEGAKAFAEFYTLEMDRATVTADSTQLRALTLATCAACKGVIEVVDDYRSRGAHQEASSVVVDLAQVRSFAKSEAVVDVLVQDKPHSVVNKTGETISTSAGARISFRHTVNWTNGAWAVADSEIIR